MSPEQVPACEAEAACARLGMQLARLNDYNWERGTTALFSGIGPLNHGWIRAWNGDSYVTAPCIALYTGSTSKGGSVNVPPSCQARNHALCQRMHSH